MRGVGAGGGVRPPCRLRVGDAGVFPLSRRSADFFKKLNKFIFKLAMINTKITMY